MDSLQVIVCGSGPAGLSAALAAAETGHSVTLIERANIIGRKLCATGNGRCNFTNKLESDAFMKRFGHFGRFMTDALRVAPKEWLLDFLKSHGVNPVLENNFHYFPSSGRAADVRDAFLTALKCAGVKILAGTSVFSIQIKDGAVCGVTLQNSSQLPCDRLILACGGPAAPLLGGSESGYRLAKSIGHTVKDAVPALAPVFTDENWTFSLAGASLTRAELTVRTGKKHVSNIGSLLFTHEGFSGPAVLDLSCIIAETVKSEGVAHLTLRVDPNRREDDWFKYLADGRDNAPDQFLRTLLAEQGMPRAFAAAVCEQTVGEGRRTHSLNNTELRKIASFVSAIPFTVSRIASMDRAMTSSGGVSLKEVDPKTMESRIVRGVRFAGEILDLTGPCGGFSIQFAVSTGRLAGLA